MMKMMKTFAAPLCALLLALQLLSSQVAQAQTTTDAPLNATASSFNVTPTALLNVTARENNGCVRSPAHPLLLPLAALGASLLPGWSL